MHFYIIYLVLMYLFDIHNKKLLRKKGNNVYLLPVFLYRCLCSITLDFICNHGVIFSVNGDVRVTTIIAIRWVPPISCQNSVLASKYSFFNKSTDHKISMEGPERWQGWQSSSRVSRQWWCSSRCPARRQWSWWRSPHPGILGPAVPPWCSLLYPGIGQLLPPTK